MDVRTGSTSVPKSVHHYVVDKGLNFGLLFPCLRPILKSGKEQITGMIVFTKLIDKLAENKNNKPILHYF